MPTPRDFFQDIKTDAQQVFIGITGGIGSGKSAVAARLREHGLTVFSADDLAREQMNTNPRLKERVNATFAGIYAANTDGERVLQRAKLAELVFGDSPEHAQNLARLNSIVHPFVWEELANLVRAAFARGERVVFSETALLFETGVRDCYDAAWVVDASEEVRVRRLHEGRGIQPDEARRRIAAQMPAAEKRAKADIVIENNGTVEDLNASVDAVLRGMEIVCP